MPFEVSRDCSPEQLRKVADLHASGITEGFLSTLGLPFLYQLYRGIADAADSGVIIAHNGQEVLGFLAFSCDVSSCYRRVLRQRWLLLGLTMLPNLFKISVYRKVFETLRYPSQKEKGSETCRPELLSMAVSDQARGQGIGKLLVAALDEEFIHAGIGGYYVVTHAADPRSNGFYTSRGFRQMGTFSSHGKAMNEYYKEIVH